MSPAEVPRSPRIAPTPYQPRGHRLGQSQPHRSGKFPSAAFPGAVPQPAQPSSYLLGGSKTTHKEGLQTSNHQPALLTFNPASCQGRRFHWWLAVEIKCCHFYLVKRPKWVLQTCLLVLAERFPMNPWTRMFVGQHQCLGRYLNHPAAAPWDMGAGIATIRNFITFRDWTTRTCYKCPWAYWSCVRRIILVLNKIWLNFQILWKCNRKHSF